MHGSTLRYRWVVRAFAGSTVLLVLSTALHGADAPEKGVAVRFTRIVYSDSGGFTGQGTGKRLSIAGDGKLQQRSRNQ
jgi:hypothetical protein